MLQSEYINLAHVSAGWNFLLLSLSGLMLRRSHMLPPLTLPRFQHSLPLTTSQSPIYTSLNMSGGEVIAGTSLGLTIISRPVDKCKKYKGVIEKSHQGLDEHDRFIHNERRHLEDFPSEYMPESAQELKGLLDEQEKLNKAERRKLATVEERGRIRYTVTPGSEEKRSRSNSRVRAGCEAIKQKAADHKRRDESRESSRRRELESTATRSRSGRRHHKSTASRPPVDGGDQPDRRQGQSSRADGSVDRPVARLTTRLGGLSIGAQQPLSSAAAAVPQAPATADAGLTVPRSRSQPRSRPVPVDPLFKRPGPKGSRRPSPVRASRNGKVAQRPHRRRDG
ncbi:hypothetical protein GGR56DRAFT_542262 [Xylariaceae sp. FL0804]|nr:hypothetical protein GGR56DRAFT_542262 [Xylariaceae sp. FL0804]